MSNETGGELILIVDDAADTVEVLRRNLALQGYRIFTASAVQEAIAILESTPVDLIITDLKMPRVSGMDLIRHVRDNLKETEVMMITGYASIEGAVEAVKAGAEEYLAKPFTDEELYAAVRRSLDKLHARRSSRLITHKTPRAPHGLIGESDSMTRVFSAISKAATSAATVLITGESGTGKELVARAIHYCSPRSSAPFVPVSCGAIPEGLLESELFGYVKGAFTGASESRAGFFQTADGGTIFLDEISETSLPTQVKLLRVLQDREVSMVGSTSTRKVDVRILAATNKNLPTLVKNGSFREDLYYRLDVLKVEIPPLRERGEDILLLAQHFARKFSDELGRSAKRFSDRALQVFAKYDWPGNVRELENVIQRLVVMNEGDTIEVADLPDLMHFSHWRETGLNRTLAEVETQYIRTVLESVGGNKSRAAQILGIDRKTLREKLARFTPPHE